MRTLIFMIGVFFWIFNAKAQKLINWAEYENLPFKSTQDSLSRHANFYNKDCGLSSDILNSDAILELRCYLPFHNNNGAYYILKYYTDSAILTRVQGPFDSVWFANKKNRGKSKGVSYSSKTDTNGLRWDVQKRIISSEIADTVLKRLIKRNLFVTDLQEEMLKTEAELKSDYNPDSTGIRLEKIVVRQRSSAIEVKLGSKFRSFSSCRVKYFIYPPSPNNPSNPTKTIYFGESISAYLQSIFSGKN